MADTTVAFNATFGLAAGTDSTSIILEDALLLAMLFKQFVGTKLKIQINI